MTFNYKFKIFFKIIKLLFEDIENLITKYKVNNN